MYLNVPLGRYHHQMDLYQNNILLFGGRFQTCLGDLWLRNLSVPITTTSYDNLMNGLAFFLPIVAALVLFVFLYPSSRREVRICIWYL